MLKNSEPARGNYLKKKIKKFRSNLGASNVVGFAWLLRPEPSEEATLFIPDIETVVHSKEYIEFTNKKDYIRGKCTLTLDQIKYIEKNYSWATQQCKLVCGSKT
ncbi:hypothetical protein NQ314_012140 [Rhamnusium bicolor]|uniref:Uncharacterized protein n=1 Tax=Rhamnusium bicolor TaxID=1586634 RepID=A0AAV8XD72_9CUCU|nr:hypothetical protein NQ314_012140 [Rhamnusium bicolor]